VRQVVSMGRNDLDEVYFAQELVNVAMVLVNALHELVEFLHEISDLLIVRERNSVVRM
jgi:hypothetical protein